MKIGVLQLNSIIGDTAYNLKQILDAIATESPVDLWVTPELFLIGYPPRDLLSLHAYVEGEQRALQELIRASGAQNFSIIVGHTEVNGASGKPFFNAASLISNGQVLGSIRKSRNPSYDIFDEERFFESWKGSHPAAWILHGTKISAAICEDNWDVIAAFGMRDMRRYAADSNPFGSNSNADLYINISASPFTIKKRETREDLISAQATRLSKPIVYANAVGAHDNLIFDGHSFFCNSQGTIAAQAKGFTSQTFTAELLSDGSWRAMTATQSPAQSSWEHLHQALSLGIRDYIKKTRHQKVLLGLSGGIDSTLLATLATHALGAENVLGVSLPSILTSELSKTEAREVAERLGIEFREIPIAPTVDTLCRSLKLPTTGLPYENLQSRTRALMLMGLSNAEGHLLLSTGNKAELAMGYSTLYGDLCGGLLPLGDLYKTEVYGLAHFINHQARLEGKPEPIPPTSLLRAPTAELAPDQKDSDSLPPYEILDAVLYSLIENQGRTLELEADWNALLAPHHTTVAMLRKKIALNEFKRFQAPPILKIQARSFGRGWTMPLAKGGPGL